VALAPVKPGSIKGHPIGSAPSDEPEHFYVCHACGQEVDNRDPGQVFHVAFSRAGNQNRDSTLNAT